MLFLFGDDSADLDLVHVKIGTSYLSKNLLLEYMSVLFSPFEENDNPSMSSTSIYSELSKYGYLD